MLKHPQPYLLLTDTIKGLKTRGNRLESKISRVNDLLHSFEEPNQIPLQPDGDHLDNGVYWTPIYNTNLIIDDEKLRMWSLKANHSSLSRHRSPKSFNPVGICINSILTSLSCHMNHHGESSMDILTSGLMIIKGINDPNSSQFPRMTIHGDCGYNNDEYFELIEDADMGFLNTTKRGLSLAFKLGTT
jgi:hypothetical protein